MNAIAHGVVDALARGTKNGSVARTAHAKGREGKGRDHTGPHRNIFFVETAHHIVQEGDAAGSVDAMMSRTIARLRDNYEVDGAGCWNWTGKRNQKGYARIWNGTRLVLAHRLSYELHVGPIPEGLDAGHLCHNRGCINPEHIRPMTRSENLLMRPETESGLGRAMTSTERNRRHRDKRAEKRRNELLESGWWVCI